MQAFLAVPDWLMHDTVPIIDVRSPAEFERGHIPGAISVPLLCNESRALVGTLYKHSGKEAAIKYGLSLIAPRLEQLIAACEKEAPQKTLRMYCARGGMRSGSFAQIMALLGYTVYVLSGGYKAYRNHVILLLSMPYKFIVLSGKTGAGKTAVLHELKKLGAQCIDLEKIACHKGSVFGALGEKKQPSQQLFENTLAEELRALNTTLAVWVEDESAKIGALSLPLPLYQTIRRAPVIYLDMPMHLRMQHLWATYGGFGCTQLITCVERLEKHLGLERMRMIQDRIVAGDLTALASLLEYYDAQYEKGLARTPRAVTTVRTDSLDSAATARTLCAMV